MNKDEIFSIWAPETSPWSVWAKPVLFAHLDATAIAPNTSDVAVTASWAPAPEERVALVLDLPGAQGVDLAPALAARGYRPVPLYNAVPLPSGMSGSILDPTAGHRTAAVDVLPIVAALKRTVTELAQYDLPPNAPPAFLLDANRKSGERAVMPDEFDNRSICFTTDFPSANFLLAHQIQRAMLVQNHTIAPQSDLAHALRRWQDGGLSLEAIRFAVSSQPEPLVVKKPLWYGTMFQRAIAALGFRRASGAGFGAWMASSAGGG